MMISGHEILMWSIILSVMAVGILGFPGRVMMFLFVMCILGVAISNI